MKIYKYIAIALSTLQVFSACKYNIIDEPKVQNQTDDAKNKKVISIAELKDKYNGGATTINEDLYIEANVVSDDTDGNFYKTMIVQDATAGIELKFGMGNLSTIYPFGSKIRVRLTGLVLGKYGDQVNLGYRSTQAKYETAFVPERLITEKVFKISDAKVEPKVISDFSQLNKSLQGQLIKLDNVKFSTNEYGKTYADINNKKSAQNRTLLDANGKTLVVRTSGYAKFAGISIPEGQGSIIGIITYFRNDAQLLLNSVRDVNLK